MLNIKISMLFFLIVLLSVVATLSVIGLQRDAAVEDAEAAISSASETYRVQQQLRQTRLRQYAERIGNSEIKASLETFAEFRDEFKRIDTDILNPLKNGVPWSVRKVSEARRQMAEGTFGDILNQFSRALVARLKKYGGETWMSKKVRQRWRSRATYADWATRAVSDAELRIEVMRALVGTPHVGDNETACFSGHSEICVADFSYQPLDHVVKQPKAGNAFRRLGLKRPEFVLVFDSMGRGVADSRLGKVSNFRDHEDQVIELKRKVEENTDPTVNPIYYELLNPTQRDEEDYLTVLVPVVNDKGKFVGAVMTGESVRGGMVMTAKRLLKYDVSYILGDRVIASSIGGNPTFLVAKTGESTIDRLHQRRIPDNEDWYGVIFPYNTYGTKVPAGPDASQQVTFAYDSEFGPKYRQLRVALSAKRADVGKAFSMLQVYMIIFGSLIFVFGIVLIWLLVRTISRPFEQIDTGIHNVINGNRDFVFEFEYKNELASSMAQSLNMMLAVLTGKPVTEEEAVAAAWDTEQLAESDGGQLGSSLVNIVRKPAEGLDAEVSAALVKEPAATYSMRIYSEYRDARAAVGRPVEGLTYNRFLEQLASNERELRSALGCQHVRFIVRTRGDDTVFLAPFPIA
jgi:hypothetical protein